jgi:hypothetical protein
VRVQFASGTDVSGSPMAGSAFQVCFRRMRTLRCTRYGRQWGQNPPRRHYRSVRGGKPVLSGSSCCWFRAERITIRPRVKRNGRSPRAPPLPRSPVPRKSGFTRADGRFEIRHIAPGFLGIPRTGDISGGWRPGVRSLGISDISCETPGIRRRVSAR